ncbi:hypothetical protein CVT25_009763 [Psilocybe cyanescens]|uniref:Uncharacterized protein n=1 Tax=Psilocybe cyanescens TaxID=93625 RepID=A0A409X8C8_PSICY|nr:hypothetical protein CVT25_009763 [Psilocybe cyanescens]
MTIAALRSLHAIIGNAIDDIECVYAANHSNPTSARHTPEKLFSSSPIAAQSPTPISVSSGRNRNPVSASTNSQAYVSPPPSPSMATSPQSAPASSGLGCITVPMPVPVTVPDPAPTIDLDFPSLDAPCNPVSLAEALTSHPTVLAATCRIVAAAGQLSATVQTPFLTLCDATMGYHLPSCMRLLEASHVVEILREAGPDGLHVDSISEKNGVKATKLAHILRLLATHHILRELSPDVFALNRISSLVDSGKTVAELKAYQENGIPEMKYRDTNGIAAFVGLWSVASSLRAEGVSGKWNVRVSFLSHFYHFRKNDNQKLTRNI